MKESVKLLRKILRKTQKEFATTFGLTQSYIAEIERGNSRLSNQTLIFLKHLWGINPAFMTGTSPRLFVDHESSLKFFQEKIQREKEIVLTRYELLALVELCRYVWSMPLSSKTSLETRQEFKKAMIDSIKHLLLTCNLQEKDERYLNNVLALLGKNIEEALSVAEKITATIRLAETLASVLCYLLESCELSEEDEKALSSFLLPWSYYVGLSYKIIRQDLIPLSSIYFSLEELFKFEKKSEFEKLELAFEKNRVYLKFRWNKFDILFKDKLKVTLDVSEVFAFFVLLAKREEEAGFSVLGFSIFHDKFTDLIYLTFDQRITVILNKEEFEDLLELVEKIKQDKELLLYLQKAYLDKYGFV